MLVAAAGAPTAAPTAVVAPASTAVTMEAGAQDATHLDSQASLLFLFFFCSTFEPFIKFTFTFMLACFN